MRFNCNHRGYKLGEWVQTQRRLAAENRLEQSRVEMLVEVGILPKPREDHWNIMFEDLIRYKNQHGDCKIQMVFVGCG